MALSGMDIEDADGGDSTDHFELLSYQSILAFLMTFGWSGLAYTKEFVLGTELSFVLAFLSGVGGSFISAGSMYLLRKLNHVPTYNKPSIGTVGRVYFRIPAKGGGKGKIVLENHGRVEEFDATSESEAIESQTLVEVINNETDLVVKPFNQ